VFAAGVASAAPSHILGLRFGGDATVTRIVVDLDGPTASPTLTHDGDNRLRLDFPVVSDGTQTGRGRGLVAGWSSASSSRGESLRFDLAGGVRVARRFMIPPSEGAPNYRYVVDLAPATPTPDVRPITPVVFQPAPIVRAEPAYEAPPDITPPAPVRFTAPAPVRLTAPVTRIATPPALRPDHRRKVVVVDAGHGGHDSGALGATRQEKDLTLAAAETLKSRLERSGRYRVILTRDTDVFIPLETRVKIARDGGADLFISLHADSAGGDAATHGASVYTLSDSGGGRVHYVLGRNEWFSKVANRADAGTSQILLDLTQRSTRNRSATFAELLLDRLAGRVDLLPRGHRDAGYFVLLAPDVPAALLEMGFITNPEDEHRLADPEQRGRMMDAVAEAIDAYFAEGRRMAAE
jgi:N-acetylmuramoyl-L-alanine amidase